MAGGNLILKRLIKLKVCSFQDPKNKNTSRYGFMCLCIGKQLEWVADTAQYHDMVKDYSTSYAPDSNLKARSVVTGYDFKPAKLVHSSTELTISR